MFLVYSQRMRRTLNAPVSKKLEYQWLSTLNFTSSFFSSPLLQPAADDDEEIELKFTLHYKLLFKIAKHCSQISIPFSINTLNYRTRSHSWSIDGYGCSVVWWSPSSTRHLRLLCLQSIGYIPAPFVFHRFPFRHKSKMRTIMIT